MRLAFVTVGDTSRPTGGYLYNARLIAGLRERGVEVEEIVVSGASEEEQGAAAESFGSSFRPSAFDVIAVDALACVVCAPHLDRWREVRPLVALFHVLPSLAEDSDPDSEAAFRIRKLEEPLLRADEILTVSRHAKSVLENRGVRAERIHVVPPGFESPGDGVVAGADERGERKPRVLCVAQWIERKGVLDLIHAWKSRETMDAELQLVGETDADPVYAARVYEAIGDDPSITVSGPLLKRDLRRAYSGADVFALPSRYEGYGMVYAEALGGGLPIIACHTGPVPEVVGEDAALLVQPGDVDSLSDSLDRLLSEPDLRTRMAAAARRRAETLPRWRDTVAGFYEALRRACLERGLTREVREQNRRSWNAVVGAHESHRKGLSGFLSGGGVTLFPEDQRLLGDVERKRVLHLLCNAGGDSLSLANLGAKVTGVDISDEAITAARDLSEKTGILAEFERADVYEWLDGAIREGWTFDVVYASYGVVCWLSDLDAWARGIAGILGRGGCFVLVDFHPVADMFDHEWNRIRDYPSGGEQTVFEEGVGDYVGESGSSLTPGGFDEGARDFRNPEPARLFRWGLGEVVTALARAGLRISALEEYPYSNGERQFEGMREIEERRLVPPESAPELPLMYGVRAEKVDIS